MNSQVDSRAMMSNAKFFDGYSRWSETTNKYETWDESVSRVMDMHRGYYSDKMSTELEEAIQTAEDGYKEKYALGAQRALQFGGDQLLKNPMRLYNCFAQETKFITSLGIKSFKDFDDGDEISVLSHKGVWKNATVKSYGKNTLNKITLSKKSSIKTVYATDNHTWILKNGDRTDELSVGDVLLEVPEILQEFDFDDANFLERLYWCYGYVYGDGVVNNNHSNVRLCGKDNQYEYRFLEMGFKSSSSASLYGDIICYTGKYKKTLPNPEKDSPELIRAFVRGYLDADGEKKESRFNHNSFVGIQASNKKAVDFIRRCFSVAGSYTISERDVSFTKTNYGEYADGTTRFRLFDSSSQKTRWHVRNIEKTNRFETVWCLEVEDDKSFILDGGIVTGNCTSTYLDRSEAFGEIFHTLLCLAPETMVKIKSGDKMIKDIEVGDEVLSYNETTKKYEYKHVYNTIENATEDKEKIELELENGATIRCTVDHKFLTSNRGWVEAQHLSEDDDIVNYHEMHEMKITKKTIIKDERKYWDISVEDNHNFILEDGTVAHNCGAGVGFSVQKHHIKKLPKIANRTKMAKVYVVEDSIEGWASSLDVLMSSFFVGGGKHPEYEGRRVYFDLSNIRPKGSFISGGFKAPGPEPLRRALDKIEYLLQGLILSGKDKLKTIDAYDIVMHSADAVLAGGVRRSATICLFSLDDDDMINAKTGDWYNTNPQRARSNNSVVLLRSTITFEIFQSVMQKTKEFGEPGFYFVDHLDFLCNPCFTGDTMVAVADGRNAVSIKELAMENKPFPVYSAHIGNKRKWVTDVKTAIAFKTGTRKTIKITLSDNTTFRCTPEHKLMLPDGSYVVAKDSMSLELEGFFTHKSKNYRVINSFTNGHNKQHRLIWEYYNGDIPKGSVIDHVVSNTPDFIDNLQMLNKSDHDRKTGEEVSGSNNAVFKIEDTTKWKNNLSNKAFLHGNPNFNGITNEELIKNAKLLYDLGEKITFENLKMLDSRTPQSFSKNRFGGKLRNLIAIATDTVDYIEPENVEYIEDVVDGYEYKNPTVIKIEDDVEEDVYDLKVEDNSNFYILTKGDETYKNSTGILVHNCVEIGMWPQLDGVSGFQGCNLSEINGGKCTTEEKFYHACRVGAILGTLQAGYTDFKFLSDVSKKIFERESLIGVSITGWMNNPKILFNADILKKGAEIVKEVNREVATLIGINPAARTTCAKPSGNACTTFDTLIKTENGVMSLKDIFGFCTNDEIDISTDNIEAGTAFQVTNNLKVYDEYNQLKDVTGLYLNGMARIYEVEFEDGKIYKFTDNHKLKTENGWKKVSDLTEKDVIISF